MWVKGNNVHSKTRTWPQKSPHLLQPLWHFGQCSSWAPHEGWCYPSPPLSPPAQPAHRSGLLARQPDVSCHNDNRQSYSNGNNICVDTPFPPFSPCPPLFINHTSTRKKNNLSFTVLQHSILFTQQHRPCILLIEPSFSSHLYCLIQEVHSSACLVFSSSWLVSIRSFSLLSWSNCLAIVALSEIIWKSAGLLWAIESNIASSLSAENINSENPCWQGGWIAG